MARFVFLSHLDFNLYRFRLPLMKALAERGHLVFAASPEGEFSDRFRNHNITHLPYPLARESMNPFREAATILALVRLLRRTRTDLLHTFTVKPNIYGSLAGRLAMVPAVLNSVTGLGTFYVEAPAGVRQWGMRCFFNSLYRFSLRHSKAVIFQNEDDRSFFVQNKLVRPEQTLTIRGSGVDTNLFRPAVDAAERAICRRGIPGIEESVVICLVARLIQDKGIGEYLEAARVLKRKYGSGVTFLLVGEFYDGNPKTVSRKMLQHCLAEGVVTHLGFCENVQEILRAADIYCLPSYREGMPMSILEAMATGLPVATTDTVGCRDTVDEGSNGFRVPVKDATRLCQVLELMINKKDLRITMGSKSREKAEKEFSVEIVVKEHLELYNAVLKELGMPGI